ncbi:helix-turn-helix domain-containing protein [Streptomyces rimosus]|uniref:helix-turn-helix domain-containing protein n=1 Tax=Streptomyces rimosus TaxID=1927 RepID=UPI0037923751
MDTTVRMRIRSLRKARGWSLDNLAERAGISPSQLSRIETGHRRLSLDQLTAIAAALGKSLDELVESPDDSDVVIRPERDERRGLTTWLLSKEDGPQGLTVGKMRITEQAAVSARTTSAFTPAATGSPSCPAPSSSTSVNASSASRRGRPHHSPP